MSDADVTITLGRFGQVVKRSRGLGHVARVDSRTFPGSERFLEDTFGSKDDGSLVFASKRVRRDDYSQSSGCRSLSGERMGRDDLRLKLAQNRVHRSRRMIEIGKKISRAGSSSELSERSSLRSVPLRRSANELRGMDLQRRADELRSMDLQRNAGLPQMDSLRSSYSSQPSAPSRLRSPVTVAKSSPRISAVKYTNEMQLVPVERRVEASGTNRLASGDVDPSRLRAPVSMPTSIFLDTHKPINWLSNSSSVPRSSRPDASPLTMSNFLHSLGLGKYVINFQAEEVDMTALKRMGDRDLKELGLPMGPRKKILLALLPPSKRSTA